MLYFHSWSGGKDSTASIILDHLHGLPPSKIIMSEVMFDKARGISGELPEHMEWVHNTAIPLFESWGFEVEILHAEKDYLDCFFAKTKKSKHPERIGKSKGFPLGGMCVINRDIKVKAIRDFYKQYKGQEFTQYVGIAIDEPKRLERLRGTNKVSLLERYGYTEQMAYDLCKSYGLLSPTYEFSKRGGCWFCPNARLGEMAHIIQNYPELWAELEKLAHAENLVTYGFKYGQTVQEVTAKAHQYIQNKQLAADQMDIFELAD